MRDVHSVTELFATAASRYPDQIAVTEYINRSTARHISYAELYRRCCQLAGHLTARGIRPGDFVVIYMQRSIEHLISILGVLTAGAAYCTINSKFKLPQLLPVLDRVDAKLLFIDNAVLVNFPPADCAGRIRCELVHYPGARTSAMHEKILAALSGSVRLCRFEPEDHDALSENRPAPGIGRRAALALFTSGSTGSPKGVLISHQDLCNRVATECDAYQITHHDRLLSLLPFSFDVGCNQLFTALVSGARLILLNSWLPKDICNVVEDYAVTGISGVPAIWSEFLDGTDAEFARPLNSVRYITISGGDLSPEQLLKLKKIIPAPGIFKTYGQTETFRSSMLKPEEYERKMTSVGRPLAGTTVYILNRAGKLAAPHERGEIIHCGDGTMMGYMGDAPGTENKLRPDPLAGGHALVARKAVFTGDTGMLDEEGYLYIIGRKDKMIKTSGYRVYPKEITDQCLGFTAVQEAVVFGVADEKIGKHIHCVIQLKPGAAATEQEIRRYLAARLPSYMVPAKIYFTDSFPRTESGKIKMLEVEKVYNA